MTQGCQQGACPEGLYCTISHPAIVTDSFSTILEAVQTLTAVRQLAIGLQTTSLVCHVPARQALDEWAVLCRQPRQRNSLHLQMQCCTDPCKGLWIALEDDICFLVLVVTKAHKDDVTLHIRTQAIQVATGRYSWLLQQLLTP